MNQTWVVKSLTAWGIFIAALMAGLPIINALLANRGWSITPEWVSNLDSSVKDLLSNIIIVVGVVMAGWDQFNNVPKQLVWVPEGGVKKALGFTPSAPPPKKKLKLRIKKVIRKHNK
jgi:hypothetical protein